MRTLAWHYTASINSVLLAHARDSQGCDIREYRSPALTMHAAAE
eukprot:SAG31_NODE_9086_length_1337_cov_1.575121_2_plen_43_part_01